MFATRGHDAPEALAARQIAAIRKAFPDAMVDDYEEFEPEVNILPDGDDAHVIAAACCYRWSKTGLICRNNQ